MNCIKDKPNNDGNIVDLIIPHLESSWLVATISKKQAAKPISLKKDDTLKLVVEYGGTTGNPTIRASKDVTFLAITKI